MKPRAGTRSHRRSEWTNAHQPVQRRRQSQSGLDPQRRPRPAASCGTPAHANALPLGFEHMPCTTTLWEETRVKATAQASEFATNVCRIPFVPQSGEGHWWNLSISFCNNFRNDAHALCRLNTQVAHWGPIHNSNVHTHAHREAHNNVKRYVCTRIQPVKDYKWTHSLIMSM